MTGILKSLLAIIFLMIFFSCKDKEDTTIEKPLPKILEYSIGSMFYPKELSFSQSKVKLIYDSNNRIIQRNGHVIPANPMTGFSYRFYEYIADTVKYYKDSIVVTKKLLSKKDFLSINEFKRKLILENNLVVKEIYGKDEYNQKSYDTLLYSYNNQKQLIEIIHRLYTACNKIYKLKYDEKGNLNLITAEKILEDTPQFRDTMWFLNYDTSPNLAKNLNIFQECFYRSLSTNNFKKYIYKSYNLFESAVIFKEERSWEYTYDENNYPIY
jgi:hypothetical protein